MLLKMILISFHSIFVIKYSKSILHDDHPFLEEPVWTSS